MEEIRNTEINGKEYPQTSEEEFEIELSGLDLDMTPIYNLLTTQYKEKPAECPQLVVVSALPEGRKTLRLGDKKGNTRVILAAEGVNLEILSALYEELEKPSEVKLLPEDSSFYYHKMDLYEIYGVMLSISTVLKIRCPQLIYTCNMPFAGGSVMNLQNAIDRTNVIILKENENLTNSIRHLAYALRQAWQHEKHEKLYYESYIRPGEKATEEEIRAYMLQKAEVDAEAFSLRFIGHMLGGVAKPNKPYAEVNTAIEERAAKLAVPY